MNKTIVINSQKEYKQFLKKLFFYKYYHFTHFKIKNNIKSSNLTIITNYLNIKKRRDRITYLYDETIKYLNDYYHEDLCKFVDNKCFVQRKRKDNSKYGCCFDCKLVQENKGCPTSNVSCKLLYCKPALKNIRKLRLKDIDFLKCYSIFQLFILKFDFYSTREQIINDLNFGLIYWLFRSTIKGIRLCFKIHK